MSRDEIDRTPGDQVRRLREERGLRPVDIQRISETVKQRRDCADFGISHATLSDIETGHSVPHVRKMFSLAVCFQVPLAHILALYGVAPDDVLLYSMEPGLPAPGTEELRQEFVLPFDSGFDLRRTAPVICDSRQWSALPDPLRTRIDPSVYSYAWIGTQDGAMADMIPGGSLVEVDRNRRQVDASDWSSLRERPIYFCWTRDGYRCCWCEEDEHELTLLPHPASHVRLKRYRKPREASIIGRVTYAWVPFGTAEVRPELRQSLY